MCIKSKRRYCKMLENIIDDMLAIQKGYELEGVEITDEDGQLALDYMKQGMSKDDAIDKVLSGIRETLDMGIEDEDEEF